MGWPPPSIAPATPADFELDGPLVVHFWAEWNAYDLKYDPIIRDLAADLDGQVHFRSCDVDRPMIAIPSEWHVLNVPAVALFRGRLHIATWIGLLPEGELRSRITAAIADAHPR